MSRESTQDAINAGKVEGRPRSWERRANLPTRCLGDVLGSLVYLGSCPGCRRQFHSRHEQVIVVGAETFCTRCQGAAAARVEGRRAP